MQVIWHFDTGVAGCPIKKPEEAPGRNFIVARLPDVMHLEVGRKYPLEERDVEHVPSIIKLVHLRATMRTREYKF